MWTRHDHQETETTQSWMFSSPDQQHSNISVTRINEKTFPIPQTQFPHLTNLTNQNHSSATEMDLRNVIREKALKHRDFYRSLVDRPNIEVSASSESKRSPAVLQETTFGSVDHKLPYEHFKPRTFSGEININSKGTIGSNYRQRRRGVYEMSEENLSEEALVEFKSVKQLRQHYQAMLEKTYKNLSPEDKDCTPGKEKSSDFLVPPSSGYCSSSASGASDDEKDKNCYGKGFRRSASSDSAVHSDDECFNLSNWTDKKGGCSPTEGK